MSLTVLDLPISITLRFGYDRRGIVSGKLLRVRDDATVEMNVTGCGSEIILAEWTHGVYTWAGRTLYVSSSYSNLDDKPVPRIAPAAKDSLESFLAWCAERGIRLAHTVEEASPQGRVQRLYRLNELTTGTEGDLIERYRATRSTS